MGLRDYLKKFGKRKAGVWGRINHKKDMRAASKAVRKYPIGDAVRSRRAEACKEIDEALKELYPPKHKDT